MKSRKSRANNRKVETSSGNVFADLGFQNAEERLLKAELASKIAQLIEEKAGQRLKLADTQHWPNRQYRVFWADSFPVFQRVGWPLS